MKSTSCQFNIQRGGLLVRRPSRTSRHPAHVGHPVDDQATEERDGGGFRVQDGRAVAEAGQGEGGDPEAWGMQVSEAMASMSAGGALTIVIPKRHRPREW